MIKYYDSLFQQSGMTAPGLCLARARFGCIIKEITGVFSCKRQKPMLAGNMPGAPP
jgi:hypothetical protein